MQGPHAAGVRDYFRRHAQRIAHRFLRRRIYIYISECGNNIYIIYYVFLKYSYVIKCAKTRGKTSKMIQGGAQSVGRVRVCVCLCNEKKD